MSGGFKIGDPGHREERADVGVALLVRGNAELLVFRHQVDFCRKRFGSRAILSTQ